MSDDREQNEDPIWEFHHAVEHPGDIIDDIVSHLDEIRGQLIDQVMDLGYAKSQFRENRDDWCRLADVSASDSAEVFVYQSGVNVLLQLRNEIHRFAQGELPGIMKGFDFLGGTVDFMSTATASTMSTMGTVLTTGKHSDRWAPQGFVAAPEHSEAFGVIRETLIPVDRSRHERNIGRLAKLDGVLAEAYAECWQAAYATTAEPERAALYQMRQVFDHFLELLAPDEQVRASEIWKPKADEGESGWGKVHRLERIHYAVNQLGDSQHAATLEAMATHMVATYKALNKAHSRTQIKSDSARSTLSEMDVIIEKWLDALGL